MKLTNLSKNLFGGVLMFNLLLGEGSHAANNPNNVPPDPCCDCLELTLRQNNQAEDKSEGLQGDTLTVIPEDGKMTFIAKVGFKKTETGDKSTTPECEVYQDDEVTIRVRSLKPEGNQQTVEYTVSVNEEVVVGEAMQDNGSQVFLLTEVDAPYEVTFTCTDDAEVKTNQSTSSTSPSDSGCNKMKVKTPGCASCTECDDDASLEESSENAPVNGADSEDTSIPSGDGGSNVAKQNGPVAAINISVPIGAGDAGDQKGSSLGYRAGQITNMGPENVLLRTNPRTKVTKDAAGNIDVVETGNVYSKVVPITGRPDAKAFEIQKSYNISGDESAVYHKTRIENVVVGGVKVLQLTSTDVVSDLSVITQYSKTSDIEWIMVEGITATDSVGWKKKVVTLEVDNETTRVLRVKHYERNSENATMVLVSDERKTYTYYPWGRELTQLEVDPDGAQLVTSWEYWQSGELTGLADGESSYAGYGKLKEVTRYDGYQESHYYTGNQHIMTTPFAGSPQGLTITKEWDPAEKLTRITKTVGTNLLSKVEIIGNGDVTTRRVYTDAERTLDTITEVYPVGQPFGGQTKRMINPDGTVSLYTYSINRGGNSDPLDDTKTTTDYSGVPSGSALSATTVTEGTQTVRTVNAAGNLISEVVTSISATAAHNGHILSSRSVTEYDDRLRVLETQHFSGTDQYFTSRQYNCCGVQQETDRAGVTTYYAYDPIHRRVKTNRLGVTSEVVRKGLTTSTHRYTESAASAVVPPDYSDSTHLAATDTNEISRSVNSLSGMSHESWNRSAKTGLMIKSSWTEVTYTPSAGLSKTSVTTYPATASESGDPSQTTQHYLDGRVYETKGDMSPGMRYIYTAGSTGLEATRAYLDGTILRESVTTKTDLAGRTTDTVFAGNADSHVYYNSLGQIEKTVDPDDVTTLYRYNAKGERIVTALDLDRDGEVDYDTDQVSGALTYPIAAHGTTVVRTESRVWRPQDTTASGGTVIARSDRSVNGLKSWNTSYPGGANIATSSVTSHSGDGNSTVKVLNADGSYMLTTITGGLTASVGYYDSAESLIKSISYSTYDDYNRPTHVRDSRYSQDAITNYVNAWTDAVSSSRDAAENTTAFEYDMRGRLTEVDAPDSLDAEDATIANVTTTSYYSNGQVKEVSGDQTYRRSYTYDYAGRMKNLRTYGTHTATTTWVYDAGRGWLTEKNYHGETGNGPGNTVDYTYTSGGRLDTRTWERGVTTAYSYDDGGRLESVDYSDGTPDVVHMYDRMGRQQFVIQGSLLPDSLVRVHEYRYNSGNLSLDEEIIVEGNYDDQAATAQYTSTKSFIRTLDRSQDSLLRPDGWDLENASGVVEHSNSYGYESNTSRLKTVEGHGQTHTYGYKYALTSSPDTRVGDTTSTNQDLMPYTISSPAHTVVNTFERNRDVLLGKNSKTPSVSLSNITYAVNAIGQRTNATHSGSNVIGATTRDFGYNEAGEVVDSSTNNASYDRYYDYDGIGNRNESRIGTSTNTGGASSTSYMVDAKNQYTAVGALNPVHDNDGNMTSGPLPVAPGVNSTLEWDAENRLKLVTVSGTTTNYEYDYLSRRVSKTSAAGTTRFVYDGWNLIAEYAGSTLKRSYTWGMDLSGSMQGAGGVGGLLSIHELAGNGSAKAAQTLYPTYDGNGNITRIIDSNSNVVCSYAYDPFGNFESPASMDVDGSGYDTEQPFGFSTKYRDAETGLYYYGYRYYDSVTGRWPSRDPIEEEGGYNLYGFVSNDGVDKWDILGEDGGHDSKDDAAHAAGVAAIAIARAEYLTARSNAKAAGRAFPHDGPGERAGRICCSSEDETFYTTTGTTGAMQGAAADGMGINPTNSAECEEGDTLVGWWHSHPGQYNTETGSEKDRREKCERKRKRRIAQGRDPGPECESYTGFGVGVDFSPNDRAFARNEVLGLNPDKLPVWMTRAKKFGAADNASSDYVTEKVTR